MKIEATALKEVFLIKPKVFEDDRGYFFESYKKPIFDETGLEINFVQDNISQSTQNTLRGLHYQTEPAEQDKLVQCISGKIFDVAVDIRPNSPTYKEWIGIELSDENHYSLLIPKGFAHGFYVLSEKSVISYKCSDIYTPETECSIKWDDPEINIKWPLITPTTSPLLSKKDNCAKFLKTLTL